MFLSGVKYSTYQKRLKVTHNDSTTKSYESENSELPNDGTKLPHIDTCTSELHDDDTSKIADDAISELPDHDTSCQDALHTNIATQTDTHTKCITCSTINEYMSQNRMNPSS